MLIIVLSAVQQFDNILGFQILIEPKTSGNAFNETTVAQKYFSGPQYVSFKVDYGSTTKLDLTGSSKLNQRQMYLLDYHKRRFGTHAPIELIQNDSILSKYFMWGTYIDMSNLETDKEDDYSIGGISNRDTQWQITLQCEQAVSSTCILHIVFHYYKSLSKYPVSV